MLEACSGFRDAGASAALWEIVAPDLLGQPIADIAEYASAQRAAGGADATAWGGVASALARSGRTAARAGGTTRGLHEVVEVIGDVTAVVATARAVAMPIAALVRRALERRQQSAQSADVQIEVDLPPAAAPIGLARSVCPVCRDGDCQTKSSECGR